jgi:hypothetical protein
MHRCMRWHHLHHFVAAPIAFRFFLLKTAKKTTESEWEKGLRSGRRRGTPRHMLPGGLRETRASHTGPMAEEK